MRNNNTKKEQRTSPKSSTYIKKLKGFDDKRFQMNKIHIQKRQTRQEQTKRFDLSKISNQS